MMDMDIMPLINRAWVKSFARVDKVISDRGWSSLNKALIFDPVSRSTMTTKEKANKYN